MLASLQIFGEAALSDCCPISTFVADTGLGKSNVATNIEWFTKRRKICNPSLRKTVPHQLQSLCLTPTQAATIFNGQGVTIHSCSLGVCSKNFAICSCLYQMLIGKPAERFFKRYEPTLQYIILKYSRRSSVWKRQEFRSRWMDRQGSDTGKTARVSKANIRVGLCQHIQQRPSPWEQQFGYSGPKTLRCPTTGSQLLGRLRSKHPQVSSLLPVRCQSCKLHAV